MFEDANAATSLPEEKSTSRQPDESPIRSLTGGSIPRPPQTSDTKDVAPLLEKVNASTEPQIDGAELSPTTSDAKSAASHRLSTTSLSSVKLGGEADENEKNKPTSPTGTVVSTLGGISKLPLH